MRCFVHFDFKMCFSLHRREIFPHRNFKKWSEHVARGTFWLKMCFSLQRRAIFPHRNFKKWSEHVARSTFWLKMCFSLQRRTIFHISSKQLPPHPRLYRGYFSTQPTHKSLKKHSKHFAPVDLLSTDFRAIVSSFFWLYFCFFIFWLCYSALLFQLSILSEVRLLNFLRLCWSTRNKTHTIIQIHVRQNQCFVLGS